MPVDGEGAANAPVPALVPADDDLAGFIASPELQAQMQALTQQAMAGLDSLVEALRRAGEQLASTPAPVPPEVPPLPEMPPPDGLPADTLPWSALPFDPLPQFVMPDISVPGGYPAEHAAPPVVKVAPEATRLLAEDVKEEMLAAVLPPLLPGAGPVAAAPPQPGGPLAEQHFAMDSWDDQRGGGGEGGPV